MSRRYKFHNPDGVYFISFAVKDWVETWFTTHRLEACASGGAESGMASI